VVGLKRGGNGYPTATAFAKRAALCAARGCRTYGARYSLCTFPSSGLS